jgi:geranylgeranyl reductase family protein
VLFPPFDADVIIVGGGPSGAAAAYDLSSNGLDVLIVERAHFPRIKPCAGGLIPAAVGRLRYPISDIIERQPQRFAFADGDFFHSGYTSVSCVVRSRFDNFCLERAREVGARLLVTSSDLIMRVGEVADHVQLHYASGKKLSARYLIAADGAKSRVRQVMRKARVRYAFAIEGNLPYDSVASPDLADTLRFDFRIIEGGYGWVFPKGDHLNIGVCTGDPRSKLSVDLLKAYAKRTAGSDVLEEIVGFPVGTHCHEQMPSSERVLFVGDAAGTCEACFGEGIHNAIRSGQLAAEAILEGDAMGASSAALYGRSMAIIRSDVAMSAKAAEIAYAAPAPTPGQTYIHPGLAYMAARFRLARGYGEAAIEYLPL